MMLIVDTNDPPFFLNRLVNGIPMEDLMSVVGLMNSTVQLAMANETKLEL